MKSPDSHAIAPTLPAVPDGAAQQDCRVALEPR